MTDDERADLLEGRRLIQISRVQTVPGKHVLIELEHDVHSFQSLTGEGKKAILKFTAVQGGCRAVYAGDIVDIR